MSTKPTPLSGFPEWLPPQRMIELSFIDHIRRTFELYGFSPVETRAVEPMDQLLRKGDTSKEVYTLRRLQADADDRSDDSLGLHFDLTVPFARYVLENSGKINFPFRRYQIQKAWRGERPQEGRYREFLQADIDIVDRGELAFHHEIEIPLVIVDALRGLPVPPFVIQTNNRKLCQGFYRGLGIPDTDAALRAVDKADKIPPAAVVELLTSTAGATEAQARACLALAEISTPDGSFADRVAALGVKDPLLDEGIEELTRVIEAAQEHAPGIIVADLKIARGLDYYTGTVYETRLVGYEKSGSICAGGRYDNLVSIGAESFPGVGISLGISRLLGLLFGRNVLSVSRSVPTAVLVAVSDEDSRGRANRVAASLRTRGVAVEVSPSAAKFGKQIRYAERRGIPYVWFTGAEGEADSVKDIRSGDQVAASAADWMPPPADLHPVISGP